MGTMGTTPSAPSRGASGTNSTFSRGAQPRHLTVARAWAHTLHLGNRAAYQGQAVILRAKLTPDERLRVAWAGLLACDDDEGARIARAVLGPSQGAGPPLAPFADVLDDARWWAGIASREELRTYVLAGFHALDPRDQADFLAVVRRPAHQGAAA